MHIVDTRLTALMSLERGWLDGEDGEPISYRVLQRAQGLFVALEDEAGVFVAAPWVDGSLILEADVEEGALFVTIPASARDQLRLTFISNGTDPSKDVLLETFDAKTATEFLRRWLR